MALFRMLWIVVSSSSVSAENAQPCPKSYYCPGQTRAWDQPSSCAREFQARTDNLNLGPPVSEPRYRSHVVLFDVIFCH